MRGDQVADQMAKEAALDPEGPIKILRLEETSGQGEGEGRPTFSEKEMREIRVRITSRGTRGMANI